MTDDTLKAERNAFLAYATLLQMECTMNHEWGQWTPEAALEQVRDQARAIRLNEESAMGWSDKHIEWLKSIRAAMEPKP